MPPNVKKWLWPAIAWCGLLVLAFVNGALREIGMKGFLNLQEPFAHQLSCLTGVMLWTAFTLLIWRKLEISSTKDSLRIGCAWLLATALFETLVLNKNMSWDEILNTYNVLDGELWGLALLWIGLMPTAIHLAKSDYWKT